MPRLVFGQVYRVVSPAYRAWDKKADDTSTLYLNLAVFLLLTILAGLIRILCGPTATDRMQAAMLLGTTGVAILLLLDAGIHSERVARYGAVVFAARGRYGSHVRPAELVGPWVNRSAWPQVSVTTALLLAGGDFFLPIFITGQQIVAGRVRCSSVTISSMLCTHLGCHRAQCPAGIQHGDVGVRITPDRNYARGVDSPSLKAPIWTNRFWCRAMSNKKHPFGTRNAPKNILAGALVLAPLLATWLVVEFLFNTLSRVGRPGASTFFTAIYRFSPEFAEGLSQSCPIWETLSSCKLQSTFNTLGVIE
jgi:hypothetical protein